MPVLLVLLAVLFTAASAEAATFCVARPGCLGTPAATLEEARDLAADNDGKDRIEVGAGTFAGPDGAFAATNPVDLVGAGRDATIVAGGAALSVLTLSGPENTVSDLTARIDAGALVGLDLHRGASATRVGATIGSSTGQQRIGIAIRHGGAVRDVVVSFDPATLPVDTAIDIGTLFQAEPPTEPTIVEDAVLAGGYGIYLRGFPNPATLRRIRIAAGVYGIGVQAPSNVALENALVDTAGDAALNVRDDNFTGRAAVALHRATLRSSSQQGRGVQVYSVKANPIEVVALDTMITGGFYDVEMQGAPVSLTLDHSAVRIGRIFRYEPDKQPVTIGPGVQNLDYGQANLGTDGVPGAGSALVDNGTPGAAEGAIDGDGDGEARIDIGALEAPAGTSPRPAGDAIVAPGPLSPTSVLPPPPVSRIGSVSRTRITGSADFATRVEVSVVRKRKGCRCAPRFRLKATGTTSWTLKLKRRLKPGRYVITSRATNQAARESSFTKAAGNRRTFRVRRKRR